VVKDDGIDGHRFARAERKGSTKAEVDEIVRWLTGYNQKQFEVQLEKRADVETYFAESPHLNPSRTLIKGVIRGVRVEDIKEPTMREIRYLDKLIDEFAKGKATEVILRSWQHFIRSHRASRSRPRAWRCAYDKLRSASRVSRSCSAPFAGIIGLQCHSCRRLHLS
jgi:hypothetical protein